MRLHETASTSTPRWSYLDHKVGNVLESLQERLRNSLTSQALGVICAPQLQIPDPWTVFNPKPFQHQTVDVNSTRMTCITTSLKNQGTHPPINKSC